MHSLVGVGMVKKKVVEQTIENLVTKVRNELNAAKAPRMGRLKSYSDIRLDLVRYAIFVCSFYVLCQEIFTLFIS